MITALRVVLIVFALIGILAGLVNIVMPVQVAEMYGFDGIADHTRWIMALGGASFIAAGIWVIAASRDPIRHIYWVKFEITKALLFVVVTAYAIMRDYVTFGQVGAMLVLFAVFAVLLLVFYPWRVKESS